VLLNKVVAPLVSDFHNPAAAAALILRGYRSETQRGYMSKVRAFLNYCQRHNRAPLPAAVPTFIGWILYELQRRALSPPSLEKYLSAVASLHRLAGYNDPTIDKLVRLAVFGFRADALERARGEQPLQRMPLPATRLLRVCALGLETPDDYLQLQCAGLVLGYVLFNRPGAAACMWRRDVSFKPKGLELQVFDFKMALRTGRERLAFTVPIDWDNDKDDEIARLLRLVVQRHDAAGRSPDAMLFADPGLPSPLRQYWLSSRVTNAWLQRVMVVLPIAAPLGGRYQGHSLRAGTVSEAYPIVGGRVQGDCGNKEGASKYPVATLTIQKRRTRRVDLPRGPRRRKGAQRLGLDRDAKI